MRIGVLTAGGDCPGLNAAIRGVGKAAILSYGMEVIGIPSGFQGLLQGEGVRLRDARLSGILTLGGTILGTSREKPFQPRAGLPEDAPDRIRRNARKLKLDALVCIGGNGTMKTAARLSEVGLNAIGIPKTIDNDVWGTDLSFGFHSAVAIATEAIDRLHTTANAHRRIMVVEVMGHHAGWIALYSGVAGGGDLILLPELPYRTEAVLSFVKTRARSGKPYSIVVAAEGIRVPDRRQGLGAAGRHITELIRNETGLEARETILGYIQRGGAPTAADRILATQFGEYAVEMIARGRFGRMVRLAGGRIGSIPLSRVAGRLKTVPRRHPLIRQARKLGTQFGDRIESGA